MFPKHFLASQMNCAYQGQPSKCLSVLSWEGTHSLDQSNLHQPRRGSSSGSEKHWRKVPSSRQARERSFQRRATTVAAHTQGSVLGTGRKTFQYEESLAVGKVLLIRTVC